MPSSDALRSAPGTFNDADLSYLRATLRASRELRTSCDAAADGAVDPEVRALAATASLARDDEIRELVELLTDLPPEGRPVTAAAPRPSARGDVDRRFLADLTAHATNALVSARRELVEGFSPASRSHAESVSRASWRELTALSAVSGRRSGPP